MLWQFQNRNSFLYGSIHMCDIDPPRLPRLVEQAMQRADRVVFEADIRGQVDLTALGMPGGQLLSQAVGNELFKRFKALWLDVLDDGPLLQTSFPGIAALFLISNTAASAGYLPQNGMDHQILEHVATTGKEIKFFEELDEQLQLLARAPMAEQVKFLRHAVEQIEEGGNEMRELVEGWKRDDVRFLTEFAEERMSWFPATYKTFLDDRNRNWLEMIEDCIVSGDPTLFVVGALHLVGPNSLPELLQERGYHFYLHSTPLV